MSYFKEQGTLTISCDNGNNNRFIAKEDVIGMSARCVETNEAGYFRNELLVHLSNGTTVGMRGYASAEKEDVEGAYSMLIDSIKRCVTVDGDVTITVY